MRYTRRQFLHALALLPALALPSLARAQEPVENKVYFPSISGEKHKMADFPSTPILDNANRANEGPPPSVNWTIPAGYDGIVVDSSRFASLGAYGCAYWNTPFNADCEVYEYFPVVALGAPLRGIFARSVLPDPQYDGYILYIYNDANINLWLFRQDSVGGNVPLQHWSPATYENGIGIGMRLTGSVIEVWYYTISSGWVLQGSITDSFWSAGGISGMFAGDTTTRMDDFGGGSMNPVVPVIEVPMVTTKCAEDPILALVCSNGDRLDLITWESGFELDDPGWRPQVAQFKGGGSYANSQIAEGQTLVAGEYDNVVDTIPLVARGTSEAKCIQTYRRLQQFIKRASDYWKEPSEYDDVWLEVRPSGLGCMTGYARVVKASCADFANPFGQPFFSHQALSMADGLSLVVEREPLWRAVAPGDMIGPLYNLLRNPDFEEWNSGVADSQPDCWSDVEVGGITGTNARDTAIPKWGRADLAVNVTNSTGAGQAKGVTQVAEGTEDGQIYTLVGWVRNAEVTNGVGRILITSLLGNYEAYRKATRHGWELATYVFTAGVGDVIGVNCEILSTAAGTVGTVYFDSLMLLKGNWEEEALAEVLPYMTSSHVYNHWDTGAGHLNYVDAWEVPGDGDALVRLELMNNTIPADANAQVERFAELRIGQRRTKDVQNFLNYYDPGVAADATASGGFRLNFTPAATWTDVLTYTILGGGNTQDNQGRFRAYTRLWDAKASGDPTLEARLRYFIGTAGSNDKTLAYEQLPLRANWGMLNLTTTAAAILERKFQTQYPSQLGATLQLRRPTGTGNAYFDYLLFLPTDGGTLLASLSPSLTYRRVLVVDNTHSATISSSYVKEHPWRLDWQVEPGATPFIFSSCVFKGDLYLGIVNTATNMGQIWRKRGGAYTKVYEDAAPNQPQSMAVFGDRIYVGMTPPGGAAAFLLSSSDGLTWTVSYTVANAQTTIQDMVEYQGGLFLATNLTGGTGYIERWDGSAGTTDQTIVGSSYHALAVYGSQLIGVRNTGGNGFLDQRVGAGVWTQVGANPGPSSWSVTSPHKLEVFQNRLYIPSFRVATTNIIGAVYDGSAVTNVTLPESFASINNRAFRAYNGKLYAVLRDAKTWVSADGVVWELSFAGSTALPATGQNWVAEVMDGELHIAGYTAVAFAAQGYVYTYADINESYSMANYTGGTFTAPNRRLPDDPRRHRWVFSYDREGYVNNIADRALVGIGYVPRYLSLLGEG